MTYSPFVNFSDEFEGELEDRLLQSETMCSYGISYLDDALIGIPKNDLVAIAARSGGGKSEIALHISMTNALKGKRVFHLALEAEKREVTRRVFFKMLAREYYKSFTTAYEKPNYLAWYMGRQEHLFEKFYPHVAKDLSVYKNLKIFYRGAEFGMQQLSMIFSSVKGQADLLVLDHLHYMDVADDNENRAYTDMVKQIRNLALVHSIPVILIAHIRKGDRRNPSPVPDMEDIHGSSDIFKVATKVITLAPARGLPLEAHRLPTYLKIAKCRQDGSLQYLTGLSVFDISRGEYEETYTLGSHDLGGNWEPTAAKPHWARRAK